MARDLDVEHRQLRAVGADITAAPERSGAAPDAMVAAPASDPASVQAANLFATRLAQLGARSATAAARVRAAGGLVAADADTYAAQEALNTGSLGSGGDGGAVSAPRMAPVAPTTPQLPSPQTPTSPTDGRHIAEIVHGGPGATGLDEAARRLSSHAADLHDTASALHGHVTAMEGAWRSDASGAAQTYIGRLAVDHVTHGDEAAKLARRMTAQADNFQALRRDVPTVEDFDRAERKVAAASAAAAINPLYAPAEIVAKTQLADLHRAATTAYASYTTKTAENLADPAGANEAEDHIVLASNLKEAPPGDDIHGLDHDDDGTEMLDSPTDGSGPGTPKSPIPAENPDASHTPREWDDIMFPGGRPTDAPAAGAADDAPTTPLSALGPDGAPVPPHRPDTPGPGAADPAAQGRPSVNPTPHSLEEMLLPAGEATPGAPGGYQPPSPAAVEQFKDLARPLLQAQGVPANQIEQQLNAMVAGAQDAPRPYLPAPQAPMPEPGIAEGFADTWWDTEQGIKNLLGAGGPGAPGVAESWGNVLEGVNERMTNPVGSAINDVKDALNSPNPAYFFGEKLAEGATSAPAVVFGPEALLGRAGLVDNIADAGMPDIVDTPHGHPSLPDGHVPGGVDPPSFPGGHGVPGGPMPFDVDPPIPTARPEFDIPNPVEVMSPELRGLAEEHLTGSGETVLGPYAPQNGGPSYIEVAQDRGASYFDIGDAWNMSTPTQQLAANQHVLDAAIANRDTITLSVPFYEVRPDTYTGAELRYIQDHGYQRINDTTFVPPS